MDDWLSKARDEIADAAGLPREALALDDDAVRTLLDLARIAAHESERTNAPLLCYLLGQAEGGAADLETLAEAVRSTS